MTTAQPTQAEAAAEPTIKADAGARLRELRAVREVLMVDRDDPEVLSELVAIEAEITRRQPAQGSSETCPRCGGTLLWAHRRLICPQRSCTGTN